jgi:O-antigen/teichoic acid export membrane protein
VSEGPAGPGADRRGSDRPARGDFLGLARDAFLQGSAQGVASLGYLGQIVLITRGLGLREFGRYAVVVALVTLVQQFVDVRVEQATITFGTRALREGPDRAAGVIQMSYAVDLVTGIAGFAILAIVAPFAGPRLVGADGTALVLLYSLTLLISTLDGTSGATLRLFDRYGAILGYATVREVARLILVGVAVAVGDLRTVLIALIALDLVSAIGVVLLAARTFRQRTGRSLRRPALSVVADRRREMFRMIFHTNVIGYSRLAQAQLPALVLGAFLGPLEVGIYKLGSTAGLALGRLSDPALYVILPRLSRMWLARRFDDLRRLLRQVTALGVPALILAGALVVWFREPILELLGGPEARSAGTVLMIAVMAQIVASALFWTGPLLIASGQSGRAARVQVAALVVQVPMVIVLGRAFGPEGAAVSLLTSYALVMAAYTILALRTLRHPERVAPGPGPVDDAEILAAAPDAQSS